MASVELIISRIIPSYGAQLQKLSFDHFSKDIFKLVSV
jgi:hypothetical protein